MPPLTLARRRKPLPKTPPAARVLRTDAEAIAAAQRLADIARPGASERDRTRTLPRREVELYSEFGLTGATVPKKYGGAEIKAVTVAEVFRILAAADPALAQIPQNHVSFLESIRDGTPRQQTFYFGRFLKGERIGNALSEARNEKGMFGFQTRMTKVPGGWRIRGEKAYCTGAIMAQWVPIFARDEQDRVWMAFVPYDAPGLTIHDDWQSMGQRTTASGTITIEDVFAPDEQVVPRSEVQSKAPQVGSAWGQIPHAAIDLGIAEEAFHDALDYIRNRTRPWHASGYARLADEPLIIQRIGEFQHEIDAARLFLRRGAELVDVARANPTEETTLASSFGIAQARIACDRAALKVTHELFELCATKSTFPEFNLDRHWRNARTHTLHDPIRWKTQYLGDYVLNGKRPPRAALI